MSDSHTRWEPTALPVLYSGTMNATGLTWPKQTLALSELRDPIPWRWTLLASAVRPALAGGARSGPLPLRSGVGAIQAPLYRPPCDPGGTSGST